MKFMFIALNALLSEMKNSPRWDIASEGAQQLLQTNEIEDRPRKRRTSEYYEESGQVWIPS